MKTPRQLCDEKLKLSEEYSRYSGYLINSIKEQADFFNTNRESYTSDKACERAFEASEGGIKLLTVKQKLKTIEKKMSAISSSLEVAKNEALGVY